jgi:8-oxo-dGTP diphosphatase
VGLRARAADAASIVWRALPVSVRRRFLHATNDPFLVGVVGLIHDDDLRILLLEHRFRTPHAWGLPGGYIEHGETFEQALAREIQEEVGLEIEVRSPAAQPFDTELYLPGRYVTVTLVARARSDRLAFSSEIVRGGFYGPGDVPPDTYPYHASLMHRFWASLRGP